MMNNRRGFGSTPRATISCNNSMTTVAFSAAPSHPSEEDLSLGTPALADAQNMLVPLGIHAHRADHRMLAEDHSIDIDDEQFQVIEAAAEQGFQLCLRGFDPIG